MAPLYCLDQCDWRFVILAPAKQLMDRVRSFSEFAFEAAARTDETQRVGPEVWQAFHASGLGMAAFSEAQGGAGLSEPERQGDLCVILRMLGAADLSVARLFEGHTNAVSLVLRYGSPAQIEKLAHDVKMGDLTGVWGAEDATGLKRHQDAAGWRLEGRKILASGAGFVQRPIVTCATDHGPVMLLLDLFGTENVDETSWTALGMRASATRSIDFTGLVVRAGQQVGRAGDYMQQPFFSGGAWRFCAVHLGAIERLTELFRDDLVSRDRGGDPYQRERLAQCAVATGTALLWIEEAALRFANDLLTPAHVVAYVNLTRMVTERAGLDVMELVQRGMGLRGFIRPHPVERICRDLSTYLRQPAPDLAMSDAAGALMEETLPLGPFA